MPGETVHHETPHRAMITACAIGATVLQLLDQTIANVALPYMQGSFSSSYHEITWVLTSYITAYHDRPGRLVSSALWSTLCGLHSWFHNHLDALRCGPLARPNGRVSYLAGRVRRRSGALVAGNAAGHLPRRATRFRHGDFGRRGDARTNNGPHG